MVKTPIMGNNFTIGYLGPPGTFSEQAALIVKNDQKRTDISLIPFPSIEDVFAAAAGGQADLAVVPLENSNEGAVNITMDNLIFGSNLFIRRQIALPIAQCLMTRPGMVHTDIIYSHSQSLAQCRQYLRKYYPGALLIPVSSNAEAARLISQGNGNEAAIGPKPAAELYGLHIKAENIQDHGGNVTTFAALSAGDADEPLPGGRTTIAFSTENEPGSLYKVLNIFSLWDINLTKILSRPMKGKPGEYAFYVDLEDYEAKDLQDALTMIGRKTDFYNYLGSYPKP
ncbi:MAG: prephenate dehydratase [Clostridiales bacterium]|jgi:prephenate dehydratase|nr:prephenate dehydratase [Clostridiales bacterium]